MLGRGPIVGSLILLAATGFLSACTVHNGGHGTVYRSHEGPVRTRTTAVVPHDDGYRYMRYRRDRHGRYHRDRHGHFYMARDGRYYRHRDDRYRRDRHGRYHRDRRGLYYRARDGHYYSARDGRYSRDRYGKDRRDARQEQPSTPTAAKHPIPPARGLLGTQPGLLKRNTGPGSPAAATARSPNPPARDLLGTKPGLLKRNTGPGSPAAATARSPKGQAGESTRHSARDSGKGRKSVKRQTGTSAGRGSKSRRAVKRTPSAVARPANTPKSAPPAPAPRMQSGILKGKQPSQSTDTDGS